MHLRFRSYLCGRKAKTDKKVCVFKRKRISRFLIRFRWCGVDGRKRYKNASVDEKLFIRFQETENGGFRKRISVDRALVWMGSE